jgi:hypothetical protein
VSCLRGSFAKSFDLVEDRIGGRGPDKRFAVLVVMAEIPLDRRFQSPHVLERAPSDPLGGDLREKALDLIEPLALVGVKCRWYRG